jgi:hypothetical protein
MAKPPAKTGPEWSGEGYQTNWVVTKEIEERRQNPEFRIQKEGHAGQSSSALRRRVLSPVFWLLASGF